MIKYHNQMMQIIVQLNIQMLMNINSIIHMTWFKMFHQECISSKFL